MRLLRCLLAAAGAWEGSGGGSSDCPVTSKRPTRPPEASCSPPDATSLLPALCTDSCGRGSGANAVRLDAWVREASGCCCQGEVIFSAPGSSLAWQVCRQSVPMLGRGQGCRPLGLVACLTGRLAGSWVQDASAAAVACEQETLHGF